MKLTPFFKETIEMRWSEFVAAETGLSFTSSQGVVYSLIRACAKGKLPAIKESLNRIDGKVATEVEVEYPKFYFLFPYATSVAGLPPGGKVMPTLTLPEPGGEPTTEDLPLTNSLRDTLSRMGDQPRSLVDTILDAAKEIDTIASYKGQMPESDPLVKSVIVAGLLKMAHKGKLGAIFEILDQIDGKVVDKIKLLGGDAYLIRCDEVAPIGAVRNAEGIYQITADNTTNSWAVALERKVSNGRING